jgi:hypothetical protein
MLEPWFVFGFSHFIISSQFGPDSCFSYLWNIQQIYIFSISILTILVGLS